MRKQPEKTGEAVFISLPASIYEVYKASMKAVRIGADYQPFFIVDIIEYYPNALNQMLWNREEKHELVKDLRHPITGKTENRLNCALLLDGDSEGILLHADGNQLLCAFYPVITHDIISRYDEILRLLELVSENAAGIPLYLRKDIRSGKKQLIDLIDAISDQMK